MVSALVEMYVQGVSTRKVKAITEELCGHSFSASTVSQATARLDEALKASFEQRPAEPYPYLILDARYERAREAGVIASQAVLVAIEVDWEGRRQVLGVDLANRESHSSWRAFVAGLKQRGLAGVEFVVSDDHPGLRAAIREVLPKAVWQRCYVHYGRCPDYADLGGGCRLRRRRSLLWGRHNHRRSDGSCKLFFLFPKKGMLSCQSIRFAFASRARLPRLRLGLPANSPDKAIRCFPLASRCGWARLSRWLALEGMDVEGLGASEVDRFVRTRRAAGPQLRSIKALQPLLAYLQSRGVVLPSPRAPDDPADQLLERYQRYLAIERGWG
ncbi:hypothetical protein CK218_28420 [Mesorhizobium sp. WSM3879]|nr:hypothetical protein CK218_28420 [Mesorhizobium sp. WSM3879]